MAVELCQAACQKLGYVYAGVEYAVECCKLAFLPPPSKCDLTYARV